MSGAENGMELVADSLVVPERFLFNVWVMFSLILRYIGFVTWLR